MLLLINFLQTVAIGLLVLVCIFMFGFTAHAMFSILRAGWRLWDKPLF